MSTTVSVVVTTFRRPEPLAACLDGLRAQTRPADEVVVVVHESDPDSARRVGERAASWPQLRAVAVARRGGLAAYNAGLAAAGGTIVAYVDDDAVAAPDWLERLEATFERDARIAAVGGRDVISERGRVIDRDVGALIGRRVPAVGRIQWFGRQIGNHHIGTGPPRDVDVLKGVNMSFRRELVAELGFDERLRGAGAQVHLELSICLPLRARGLRLVYDPAIVVHHHPAPRAAGDDRSDSGHAAIRDASHNEALAILDNVSPGRRIVFAAWSLAVGTSYAPGLAIMARQLPAGVPGAWGRFVAAQAGRVAAWRTRRASQPATTLSPISSSPCVDTDRIRIEQAGRMSAPARNRLRRKLVERVSSPTPLARRIKDFGTELRGAKAFTPASRPRYWADAIAFRFLRLAPVLASERVRTIVLRDGTKLSYRLNRGDIQAIREVWLTPTYLPPSPRDRIGVCVDIGANIGFTTLYFARHHGAGECVVVEPDAGNAGLLRRNLEQNGIRAVVLEAAVGRSDGVGRFAQSQESNLGRLAEAGVPVNVLSMPSVLANVEGRRVDLLKVDIEGGEAELFAGDTSWLDRVDAIVIEFHQEVTAPAPIISRITSHGFRHVPSDSMREGTTDAFVR